jgi:hypothetical protein
VEACGLKRGLLMKRDKDLPLFLIPKMIPTIIPATQRTVTIVTAIAIRVRRLKSFLLINWIQ